MKNFSITVVLFGFMVVGNAIAMEKSDINPFFRGFDAGSDQIKTVQDRVKNLQNEHNQLWAATRDVCIILSCQKEKIENLEKTVGDQKDQIEELYAMIDITHEAFEKEVTKNSKKRKPLSEKNNRLRNILKNKK